MAKQLYSNIVNNFPNIYRRRKNSATISENHPSRRLIRLSRKGFSTRQSVAVQREGGGAPRLEKNPMSTKVWEI